MVYSLSLLDMKERDFRYALTQEDTDRIRIAFREEKGAITFFIVQYSALINNRWRSIMRYDTCHGYAHKHTYNLRKKERIVTLTAPGERLNELFTESSTDIKQNFEKIKENFLKT